MLKNVVTRSLRDCRRDPIRKIQCFSSVSKEIPTVSGYDLSHEDCNITPIIAARMGVNLHQQVNHPLYTIKRIIQTYWKDFIVVDDLSPIVTAHDNFDSLLIPKNHVTRSKSDTYYLRQETVLRTHTSAHQVTLLQQGLDRFLVTGDVYRRDEIDSSHYPIFHQMEGVKMFHKNDLPLNKDEHIRAMETDLKQGLEGMVKALFGNVQMRWVDAYFPFTEPSFELEIYFHDQWMEVLGCGVIQQEIVKNAGRGEQTGWAFGLGLERLAMVLFSIPDIRLFWSNDGRFHDQFRSGEIITFQPYSKYPACCRDLSFWTPDTFHPNDLNEVIRDVAGDLAERVELIDSFTHPKTLQISNCFRISYRSMDRSLTNAEIDELQSQVRDKVVRNLGVELR